MIKNRIKTYWMLLMSLLLIAAVSLSIGTAQARPENTVTSMAVLSTSGKTVTSNCLITEEDKPRTVLLGEVDLVTLNPVEVPFWLLSAGADTKLTLGWTLSDQVPEEYFRISLKVKDESEEGIKMLASGTEVELLKDTRQEFILCLEPTNEANQEAHDKIAAEVYVTAGETLKGTFQVVLPEVKEEESEEPADPENPAEPGEPTDPEEPADPEEPTNPENPETPTEPGEPTDPEEPTDTEETTEPTSMMTMIEEVDPVEISALMTLTAPVIQEEPKVSEEFNTLAKITESEKTTDSETEIEETKTETETKIEAKTKTEPAEEELSIGLKTISVFDIAQQLPVVMTLEEIVTHVRFGILPKDDERITLEALPDYTMYSEDDGETYFMVYGDYIHEFVPSTTTIPLLLDFRYTDLVQDEKLTIAMEVFWDGKHQKTCAAETTASVKKDWQVGPVLNFENKLEYSFPREWQEPELTYSVEYLTITEEQTLQYIPVELSEDGLQAIYDEGDNNHRLLIKLGQKFIQPGAYKLHISWSFDGLCYDNTQTNFFVNCSGRVEPGTSGSEVLNDE